MEFLKVTLIIDIYDVK